jgi:endonuclease VIII
MGRITAFSREFHVYKPVMPEGDTLYRAAETLRKALLGKQVRSFESSVPEVAQVANRVRITGRVVSSVEARGKHLLITLSEAPPGDEEATGTERADSDYVLHTHMRMNGSWHLYRPEERWQKPARLAVVTIHTEDFVAPCFSAPVVELLSARQAERHPDLSALGPDAMTESFDAAEARARMRRRGDAEIGVALLNQRVMAGVGNVYKSEVMFVKGVSPFARVADLSDEVLDGLIAESHRLMRLNDRRGGRRTRFTLNAREKLWVYGRSGEPCYRCGETIRMRRQGLDARSTYYCPGCQEARTASEDAAPSDDS